MNQIFLRNYTIIAKHGYYKEEHFKPQRFVVDVECEVESNKSGVSDDLNETFNYEIIRKVVDEVIRGESHKLLEYLAEEISNKILKHSKVLEVSVQISKPDIWGDCEPGVCIVRDRNVL
jgi:dihydroneopterin aldolase/2-amino-4-hydroxy-6-hydroxymethyldihydropteridine diphosphokinase